EICASYDLWSDDQNEQLKDAEEKWPRQTAQAGLLADGESPLTSHLADNLRTLALAACTTVLLSCISMPLAMGIGLLIAVGRLYGPWPLAKLLGGYVEFLRGTPLLLQLFVIYFVFPEAGLHLNPFWSGVMGL